MSVAIETAELISALENTVQQAIDLCEATEDADGEDMAARGHNSVRDAAKDAHNICNNLLKRLGAAAVMPPKPEPAPEPVEQPEPEAPAEPEPTASESMLSELEATKAKLDEQKPPEEIASFFEGKPHGMAAQELLDKCTELGHLVQMKLATSEQSDMHTMLLRHQPYLRSKAVDVI